MTYAPRLNDEHAPLEQLYARMAAYGFAPVLRDAGDKKSIAGLFLFNEMWRLDNPRVRAYIGLDMAAQGQMVVRFINETAPAKWGQFVKSVFDTHARLRGVCETTLGLEDVLSSQDNLPYCQDVSQTHAALAMHLHHHAPTFFIRPGKSDHKNVVLEAMQEPPFKPGGIGGAVQSCDDAPDFITRLARVAAAQLRDTYHIALRVSCAHDDLLLHAYRKLPCAVATPPQSLKLATFMDQAAPLIARHIAACRAAPYPPVPPCTP